MTKLMVGRWENTYSENFDEFLRELGFGLIKRKMANSMKPTMVYSYSETDGRITQKTITSIMTIEIVFELGVEFEEDIPQEKDMRSRNLVTLEGNRLIHKVTMNGVESLTIREFNGDEMVATHSAGSAVGIRKFKRVGDA